MSVGSIGYAQNAYLREMLSANSAGHAARKDRNLPASETTVSISDGARERLQAEAGSKREDRASAGGLRLDGWKVPDFSDEILAEARARLAERRPAPGIGDGSLPAEVSGLPILPENQELLEKIRAEMGRLRPEIDDPAAQQRFNELMNLHFALQRTGWAQPMTKEDLSREVAVTQAMGMLRSREAQPGEIPDMPGPAADPRTVDPLAGWRKRWEQDGRTMPPVEFQPGQSLWLDLAKGAGIDEGEFLRTAREFAKTERGEALTQRIEGFVSDRYAALKAAEAADRPSRPPLPGGENAARLDGANPGYLDLLGRKGAPPAMGIRFGIAMDRVPVAGG